MSDSTKKTKEFLTLKVGVKEPFKPTHETETVTKTQLLALVDSFFKGVFNDFHKADFVPMQLNNGTVAFDVVLNFRPKTGATEGQDASGKFAAFVEEEGKTYASNATLAQIINNSSAKKKGTRFMISQPATELLRGLFLDPYTIRDNAFYSDPKPQRYCNLGLVAERVVADQRTPISPYMGGMPVQIIETAILHIDINKLMGLIKGDKGPNGEVYTYSVRFLTDLFANQQNQNGVFSVKTDTIIEIMRGNTKEWDRFMSIINGGMQRNEIYSDYQQVRY